MMSWGIKFLLASRQEAFITNVKRNSRLANYSLSLMRELQEDANLDFHYSDSGTLLVFREQTSLDCYLEHLRFLQSECDVNNRVLDITELINQEPSLQAVQENLKGGVFFPDDASGDCHLFCKNLSETLQNRGVQFLYETNVKRIDKLDSLMQASLDDGESIKADKVVLAAGAYSPHLLGSLGIRLPVYPAKGYSLTISMDNWENRPTHLIADMSLHAGVVPMGGKNLRIAGTAEFTGFGKSIPEERVENLLGLVEAIFPEFATNMDRNNINPWSGLRPMSADGVPILGKTNIEGLYINTGHGHLGWTMGAASGRAVADTIMGKTPEVDMNHYSVERF
jgi:D-amino-acid dehydrogenase